MCSLCVVVLDQGMWTLWSRSTNGTIGGPRPCELVERGFQQLSLNYQTCPGRQYQLMTNGLIGTSTKLGREAVWRISPLRSCRATNCHEAFAEYTPLKTSIPITTRGGTTIHAIGGGTIAIQVFVNDKKGTLRIREVLYAPRVYKSCLLISCVRAAFKPDGFLGRL